MRAETQNINISNQSIAGARALQITVFVRVFFCTEKGFDQ
nr:MAG TPA: hypothetical protein [Bacteriophage sp.]